MKLDKFDDIYDDDLVLFPTIEEYIAQLDILKNLDFSTLSHQEIEDKFYDYATIFPQIFATQNPERFNLHTLYRIRLNIDTDKEDLNLIQTYSYPLPEHCTKNGRANIKGKSVFYCSNKVGAALFESKPKRGDKGYLSIWKPIAKRPIKIGVALPADLRADNPWHELARSAFLSSKKFLSNNAGDKYNHFVELNKFIADRYVHENYPYPITSWLSNEFLYGQKWKDLILYPSIATDKIYCNMAIHPNTVNTQLILNKVIKFIIRGVEGEKILYSPGYVGEVVNTNLIWRESRPDEKDFFIFE
jgi:hypothetical protein